MTESLWRRIAAGPLAGPLGRERVRELADAASPTLRGMVDHAPVGSLLAAFAEHAPFLWQLARADLVRLEDLLAADPSTAFEAALAEVSPDGDLADVGRTLRRVRQRIALLVAMADCGGVWTVEEVMRALSRAADTFVRTALAAALKVAARGPRAIRLADPAEPEASCGLVVLALGKLGADELNYSSDIDLIVVYDPASPLVPSGVAAGPVFVRIVQQMARLLSERTAEGHVLRVDLRLRPDPGSTAVAIALPAAFAYYESFGQNWERAALIKARPIAGDLALGTRFVRDLAPFIWRRYFDYAAIADIHAMKRQIHAVRGGGEIAVAGHDVKLGRGGIREIEFFVQTQQLIFGGKRPALRGARTLDMLAALHADGWVTADAVVDLGAAYRFLRTLEHRLQMVADAQTHRIPGDPDALESLARLCGFADATMFGAALNQHQARVVHHYGLLFEGAPALDTALGSLVFTGVEDDPETLETLAREGFRQPTVATETIRGWHFGRRPAVRSARARERLTELMPALLDAFARSGDPDAALAAFDDVLGHMPAASELFALLNANSSLRNLFADVLGGAPPLARIVAQKPHLLDAALAPGGAEATFDVAAIATRVSGALQPSTTQEEELDAIRDATAEERFAIGLRLFSGELGAAAAGVAYAALAEAVVTILFDRVSSRFAGEHGRPNHGSAAVVALGRFGARAMTATSDLDLMLIYDFDGAAPMSDGPRPLHAVQYYTRLTQRLLSALTVATRRGRLYEVDMRLRPSGRQGPLATQLSAFRAYQATEAETWERMALTRARLVAGDPSLAVRTESDIRQVLLQAPAPSLATDVRTMRKQVADAKGEHDVWDLKHAAGGIMDLDFLAQFLQLQHGHARPDLLSPDTGVVLERAAGAGLLGDDGDLLRRAHALFDAVLQIMRLVMERATAPERASLAVRRRLAAVGGLPDVEPLRRELADTQTAVRSAFDRIVR